MRCEIVILNQNNKIMNKNKHYLVPTTEVVQVKMETHLLEESQSWPAGAPVNAQRNGYEEGGSDVW